MQLHEYTYTTFEKEIIFVLTHTAGIGRKTIRKLLLYLKKHEHKSQDLWVLIKRFSAECSYSKNIYKSFKKSNFEQKKLKYFNAIKTKNIRVTYFCDVDYPQALLDSPDYPLLLFYKGSLDVLNNHSVAVVGTRNMTQYGQKVVRHLVPDLVSAGLSIVSGGMYGVDLAAHKSALEFGGNTVIVLGYGFQYVSRYLTSVIEKVLKTRSGCILTEYPYNIAPNKGTFPERNRIVAGLSLGVLVVEAAKKSGTHITVSCALEAGREVFAVSGSIFNPYTEGTKILLQQGAILITNADDIFTELNLSTIIPTSYSRNLSKESPESDIESTILKILKSGPETSQGLAEKCKLQLPEMISYLSMLEISNKIVKDADHWHRVLS